MQADTSRRPSYAASNGINLSTLQYRAPELLFGDLGFGFPIDSWSIGIMMCELSGYFFTGKVATVKHAIQAILQQLGTLAALGNPFIRGLPNFGPMTRHEKKPWPASVHLSLGRDGVELLEKFLCLVPTFRTLDTES